MYKINKTDDNSLNKIRLSRSDHLSTNLIWLNKIDDLYINLMRLNNSVHVSVNLITAWYQSIVSLVYKLDTVI